MASIANIYVGLDVPDSIMEGLDTGRYKRCGGTVREADGPGKGRIVALLDSADPSPDNTKSSFLDDVAWFCRKHKSVPIIAGVLAVGYGGYRFFKRRKKRKAIAAFETSLREYLDDLRAGRLITDRINALILAIDELKRRPDFGEIVISLTVAEVEFIVRQIHDFTIRLAEYNRVELTGEELRKTNVLVYDLRSYLLAQKRILNQAA